MDREVLLVEAALFSAGKALSVGDIAEATGLENGVVRQALKKLGQVFNSRETALEIQKIGPKYQMKVREDFVEETRLLAPKDIPQELVKTLSLIAYHQPLPQSRLVEMVGSRVYSQVKTLVDMGLVVSRSRGRTKSLSTTRLFLERFGIDAKTPEGIRSFMEEKME